VSKRADFGAGLVENCDVAILNRVNRGVKLRTRLSPGTVIVWLAQGACLVRGKVQVCS